MASPLHLFFKICTSASLIFISLLLIPFSNCWIGQSYASLGEQLIPLCMELSNALVGAHNLLLASLQGSMCWMFILSICRRLLYLLISIMHIGSRFIQVLEGHIISSGFLGRYQAVNLEKPQYLAIVVDSEEAKNTTKLKQLLQWLSEIGVNHVIMYDMEGVLKNSMDTLLDNSTNSGTTSCFDDTKVLLHQGRITLELLSFSDGKEGTAKAASILCSKYLKSHSVGIGKMGMNFTETAIAHVLKIAGCGGPDPDLLLIFGPARCHLGFPAWRMRYTEIVHMGSLKSLTYGAIVKAIHDYSKTQKNYGT